MFNIRTLAAVIGLSLTALSLTGSTEKSARIFLSNPDSPLNGEIQRRNRQGRALYAAGKYLAARTAFHLAAELASRAGDRRAAAMNWSNAGGSALVRLDYRGSLDDLLKARRFALASGNPVAIGSTLNNLASLYLQMGNTTAAIQVANEALAGSLASSDPGLPARLRVQLAEALARSHRFDQANGLYRAAASEIEDQGDFDTTVRVLANWGDDALEANRIDEAESVLANALFLAETHHLVPSANVFRVLAKIKARRGDVKSAAILFNAALKTTDHLTPRWSIYLDRAEFRLDIGDIRNAYADFREAHRLAMEMRLDIVPADQDRVALEGILSRTVAGLIEAGNRLARETHDARLLQETFDAAEQERIWSLRALVPTADDWRKRLPNAYWDLLALYQAAERALLARPSADSRKRASGLELQLAEMEANASGGTRTGRSESALAHIRSVLDNESVIFTFHVTKSGGWVWAADRNELNVYALPDTENLRARVAEFVRAAQKSDPAAVPLGRQLYQDLFGSVPAQYRSYKRWLLELDGPLFDLPFAALVAETRKNEPIYLVRQTALQMIPSALMLAKPERTNPATGEFLGIGDPIYNAADSRYTGKRRKEPDILLPRLIGTRNELQACSRALGSGENRILTGQDADLTGVRAALRTNPSVIHFATHIITAPANHESGLIALSLDRNGRMGLMGPAEIAAYRVSASLVVLNGCHSAQGEALPGSGLMGLTRAWIGAGARAVLATRWEIPDEAGETVMARFYKALRVHSERNAAQALRDAQLGILKDKSMQYSRSNTAIWAAYFLLGRE